MSSAWSLPALCVRLCHRRPRVDCRALPDAHAYASLGTTVFAAARVGAPLAGSRRIHPNDGSGIHVQDLPPVKFGDDFGPLPRADVIELKQFRVRPSAAL